MSPGLSVEHALPASRGLCTCCSGCLEASPPDVCMAHSLTSFRSHPTCALIRDAPCLKQHSELSHPPPCFIPYSTCLPSADFLHRKPSHRASPSTPCPAQQAAVCWCPVSIGSCLWLCSPAFATSQSGPRLCQGPTVCSSWFWTRPCH